MITFFERLIETKFWFLITGLLIFRLLFIFYSGFDLVGDEAYYWDWSRRPDWCYYSKPPMVAWLMGIATWTFGDTVLVVRSIAVLLGTGFLIVFYQTTKAFYSSKAAGIALLLLLVTPANAISNLIMTIDPPLFFFWIVAIYFLYSALFENKLYAWWLAGAFTALAFLSKPVAVVLPLLLGIFLVFQAELRHKLRREFLYYLLPLFISFIPLVFWNLQNDKIMLQHIQGHFSQDKAFDLQQRITEFFVLLGLQLLLLSPLVFVLLVKTSGVAIRSCFKLSVKERFLMWVGPVPLVVVLVLALLQKVQGNWPLQFYFATIMILSGWLAQGIWVRWLKPTVLTGLLLVVLTYSIPFSIDAVGLSNTRLDPTHRLRQWKTLAQDIEEIRQNVFPEPEGNFIWIDAHRYMVSELAFYLPDHPKVFRYAEPGIIESQYELWPGPEENTGKDALVLSSRNLEHLPERLRSAFQELRPIDTVVALQGTKRERHYYVYLGKHYNTIPTNTSLSTSDFNVQAFNLMW